MKRQSRCSEESRSDTLTPKSPIHDSEPCLSSPGGLIREEPDRRMSNAFDFDLLCIGSGPAGQRAAVQAAKLGKRVAMVEKRRIVGGVCLDTGTIPSKTFREAVLSCVTQNGHGDSSQEYRG